MNCPNKPSQSQDTFGFFCDWGIVAALSVLIFVLPASIAILDSFAALAIFIYFIKKIYGIVIGWPSRPSHPGIWGNLRFIWDGLSPPVNFLNRPLQILTLAVFASVLFSQYPALSLKAFLGKFLKYVFLYFCIIEVLSDEERIRVFLKFFLFSAFIAVLDGVFQHFTGRDFLKGQLIGTENAVSSQRISATFYGANGFGAYLLPVIGLVAHLLYKGVAPVINGADRKKGPPYGKPSRGWTVVMAFFLVLLLACLCWTYSRSAWLGYLMILFVMVCLDRRKMIYAGVLFLVFIFIFLPSLNNVRHMDLISDNITGVQHGQNAEIIFEQSGSGRSAYWKKAISIFHSSPVYGTGLNSYAKVVMRDPDRATWWYAHNGYLQMAAETGLLGLISFLWLLFVLLRQGLNYCKIIKAPRPLNVLQGLVCGISGFLVQSFFDNTFYSVQLAVLMWLVFGTMVAVMRLKIYE